ncbi:MAG: transcriptional regulator AlsR family [Firmicutes bacterium]|nr:transcriptional regulator AlsR family [Bacillota bacterium]
MDIRQLRYFISVANNLNFTAAAKELHIAQPYLSKQIAELESQTGLKLFERNTRYVELTVAGTELLKEATFIVARAEAAVNKARLAAQGSVGNLKIGFMGPLEKEMLPVLLKKFRMSYPMCNLSFSKLGWGPLNEALVDGSVDIAFTVSDGLERLPGISWKTSRYFYPLSLVVPSEHPLAQKERIHLSALSDEPFIVLSREESPLAYENLRRICVASGFYPKIVCEASMLETLLLMVDIGMGIAIQTKHTQAYASPSIHYIELEGSDFYGGYVVAWRQKNTNPLVQLFIEVVEKEHFIT